MTHTLNNPFQYWGDPTRSRSVGLGLLFVGLPDEDPEFNQVDVFAVQPDGTELLLSQPISLTAGGIPSFNGAPVQLKISAELVSVKLLDSVAAQVYYTPTWSVASLGMVSVDSLAAANSTVLVGGIGAGVISRRVSGVVSILEFGAVGDGVTNNDAAMLAARDYLLASLAAGNRVKLVWPAGRYAYNLCPNWAMNRLYIEFQGEVWLINNGSESSWVMDGGATGPGVYGCVITGFPQIYGDVGTKHGVYMRAVQRSDIEIECRGAGPTFAGLYQEWNVSCTIKFLMNFNAGGLYSTPAIGISQNLRLPNEETSYCLMINCETSGMPIGVYQDGALGNVFQGGAVQACSDKGLVQTVNAWNNKFYGTDFEVNTNVDIECNARESQFYGVDCEKKIKFLANAVNCTVNGGVTENVEILAGAERTLLTGLTYNRFGLGTIVDGSETTRYRDLRNKGLGLVHNKPRARTEIIVGASPFTYENESGQDETVNIIGGTVSAVDFVRFTPDPIPVSGMVTLSPGDSVVVTYSIAPDMVKYTR